jgi:hypothetical protein
MPIKKKSAGSFLIEGSLLAALDKNRMEAKNLKAYCEKLDRQLNDSCFQIEKQNYENYKLLQDIKQERMNSSSKMTLINDNLVRGPIYFDLMRSKAFDSENTSVPDLLKSLRDQEIRSATSVRDLLAYNGRSKPIIKEKLVLNDNKRDLRSKQNVSLINNYIEKTNSAKRNLQYQQRCQSSNPRLYGYSSVNVMSALSFKSLYSTKSDEFGSISSSNWKSIRRSRQPARILNMERDKKIEFLQNSKKLSYFNNICSKRCQLLVQE